MFTDGRSRRVVFLAHCLLNQNAISDGTAEVPAAHREILRTVLDARVGVVQLPCPELCCLGLDRGDPKGGERPVVAENTRIRRAMGQPEASARLRELTDQVVWQIREYQKHGFAVLGIVGVDRSPCCGVNTTSDQDRELPGRGVFIASLRAALESAGLTVPVIGIKPSAPEALDRMLDRIFSGSPVAVSLKTRLGLEDPEEFARLLEIFGRYPVSLLIVHPRVRKDFYRHPVRVEYFEQAVDAYHGPLCFNGGLVTAEDCARFARRFPQVDRVMIGQGLLADPALVQKAKGGPGAGREALRAFHDELYHTYLEIFASQRNTVFHMKELWSYLGRLFQGAEKPLKQIRKAADSPAYEAAVAQIFALPLRQDACWGGQ